MTKSFPVKVLGRYVKDFSVPQGLSVEIGQKQTFTFTPTQSGCIDASIVSLSSSDASVIKTSYSGLTATFEALYVGTCTITVKVGGVTKTFSVTGTGKVATGVDIPAALNGGTLTHGQVQEFTIVPTPTDAYDGGTITVTARNPEVCSVTSLGNFKFRFNPSGYGKANFDVSVGRYKTSFSVTVPETIGFSSSSLSVVWGESGSVTVVGNFTGWSYTTSGEAFEKDLMGRKRCELSVSGNAITITNTLHEQRSFNGTLTVTSPVTGATARLAVTLSKPSGEAVCSVSRDIDYLGRPVVQLRIVNQSASDVSFSKFYGYVASGPAYGYALMSNVNFYVDALNSYLPNELYLDIYGSNKIVGRLAEFGPSNPNYYGSRKILPYEVYEESWVFNETHDDIGYYTSGCYMTWKINSSGVNNTSGLSCEDF